MLVWFSLSLMKMISVLFFSLLILSPFLLVAISRPNTVSTDNIMPERFVGGRCEYKKYKGQAKISSLTKKIEPDNLYEKYEVKFIFIPEEKINEPYAEVEGREFLLLLSNSSYPGPKFLEKYGIEVDRVFDCYLKVITKGTCTPTIFEFPTIKLDDYLEN